ncbi:hypothetical protein GLOTRDRAFT_68568 [Gloeophyllum trabeum ATCC 11539]|uniref:Uncharacterized protein n=1 Tax=Gloeophyllum trabeum (strain ATCC 11539 / FP-39264 / Madison 617) TaxID=670483 RepID=S7QMS4_GLOTA|nr:uncharacterized protein GLOTRDRAFT_68568 [Gloeophyllum trabeum ATCC 11539]EPQ60702.1 hypothetical protein GLOTRDRAFT_68568 [Gloeophyllum trabeum ATCC 11539]
MTTPVDGRQSTATASVSSLAKSQSVRSHRGLTPSSTIKTVVTVPPWARDEPPSPHEEISLSVPGSGAQGWTSESRPSDLASSHSSSADPSIAGPSRWWSFARARVHDHDRVQEEAETYSPKTEKRGLKLKDRSMSWLSPGSRRSQDGNSRSPREKDFATPKAPSPKPELQISLPPPTAPFTLAQNQTPGWNTPWMTPQIPDGSLGPSFYRTGNGHGQDYSDDHDGTQVNGSAWQRRKRKIRKFLLTNAYAPLLFRFINITFTTAALAVAIRIRILEKRNNIMGAVGASPTLVVIFAPLTLVHVLVAIYAEYFSRPLGLWHTSSKLAHTLLEVVFICAWSAALALCFDNFFTSIIPCASWGSVSWYNTIPRPQSPVPDLGRNEGGVGDRICDGQLALICLVGVGLIMYCINLVISLYRIFEKVKYRPVR